MKLYAYISSQTGEEALINTANRNFYHCLQTTIKPHSPSIDSWSMVRLLVESTQGNGLAPLPQLNAFSMFLIVHLISISNNLRALSEDFEDAGLSVYVTNDDSEVYEDKFREIATSRTGQMTPTLILLGIRLGIDRVTPVYHEALKACLHFPQSVGIAG
jgi:hypothetical protein